MEEALKEYDLHIVQSNKKDRMPIDFEIRDSYDTFCTEVWGKTPDDVEITCEHPAVEFDDDETVGECPICGATCDWHYESSADDGYVIQERVPHDWHIPEKIGGIVGKYLQELEKEW